MRLCRSKRLEINVIAVVGFRLSLWFIPYVDSALEPLHHVNVSSVSVGSMAHPASIFIHFSCLLTLLVPNEHQPLSLLEQTHRRTFTRPTHFEPEDESSIIPNCWLHCYSTLFYPNCYHLLYALGWQSRLRHPPWNPIPVERGSMDCVRCPSRRTFRVRGRDLAPHIAIGNVTVFPVSVILWNKLWQVRTRYC
jgi:hypothetical protein